MEQCILYNFPPEIHVQNKKPKVELSLIIYGFARAAITITLGLSQALSQSTKGSNNLIMIHIGPQDSDESEIFFL